MPGPGCAVGKRFSASDMLNAHRGGGTKQLDDSSTCDFTPSNSATRQLDAPFTSNSVTSELDDQSTSSRVTSELDAQSPQTGPTGSPVAGSHESPSSADTVTSRLVVQSQTYQRVTVFLTPDQRKWLKDSAKDLPVDGLSASDIVRLALMRLRSAVDGGDLKLVEALTKQAHEEAERLTGRRNRGLPTLTEARTRGS